MEISKSAVLLANEHQSDQKNVTNDFRIDFRNVFVLAKNDAVNGMPENVESGRVLIKMAASVFHSI